MQDEFGTYDLYLAAFLKANGATILRSQRDGNRLRFIFCGGEKTESLKNSFLNNGLVPVGDYRRCLNDLKTEIFAL